MGEELILRGRIVSGSMDIEDGLVAVDGGHITYAGPASGFRGEAAGDVGAPDGNAADGSAAGKGAGHILMPGLVDLHCHGAHGSDFSEGSVEGARAAARYLHGRGTTTLLASLVTAAPADLLRSLKALRTVTEEGLVAGSHLEGPFLSPGQCGAHDPSLLLEPDAGLMAELLEAAGPSLASMTLAPELPGAGELADLLSGRGVIPSLGHTAADHPAAASFLERAAAGLSLAPALAAAPEPSVEPDPSVEPSPETARGGRRPTVTHLFNAMPSLHHRSPGPVSACLSAARAGNAVVELIADGVHLAPDTVKTVFELVGANNIALVTDSMAATGLQDGHYKLGTLTATVEGGVARVNGTGAIAGGTATLLDVVRTAVAAGVALRDAITSASAVPAAVLGLSLQAGDLRAGMPADIVVVNTELQLAGVLRRGEWVTGLQSSV
ncbi:amidohydrolase family protein [Pseudarthrobacter sp. R1]|uniref:N-acetylglucosamine-6-phosphate deacetylase n=1 Tax=Pseudarthrobacter sp. R1 TaxID=2944934 RepID=UPI00210BCE16|nr:amidohydrolase family protein [Pseudarthrobacter sp. R1]MCQ6269685.1 amidohydrolase family protein [Pseudarthrobacter sp. R1]